MLTYKMLLYLVLNEIVGEEEYKSEGRYKLLVMHIVILFLIIHS